ncbi:MAG: hypothetical protein ACLGIK_09660 [Gemmatimonadota bacterium]
MYTRSLATRLRRLVHPPHRTLGARTPAAEAWTRLGRALSAPERAAAATRQRELAQENMRLAVTLLGQEGRGALERLAAARDGAPHEATEAVRAVMAVAAALGHTL